MAQVVKQTGSVVSSDGTRIGYTRFGSGPAVVVVHGAFDSQQDWLAFAELLAATHTVYVYDRRGLGQSPDVGQPYAFAYELDDLAALVALAGPAAALVGHSFGGGVALAYAIRAGFSGRLVLYEAFLPRITCPVLVIQGEQDEYGTLAQVAGIVQQVAGEAHQLVIPGSGHTPHRDAREVVLHRTTPKISQCGLRLGLQTHLLPSH